MQKITRIVSSINKNLYATAITGHFATNHSHLNCYFDMTTLKHSQKMSAEAARSIAFYYSSITIDTMLCLEGTEYIGAALARELMQQSMRGVNTGKDISLLNPGTNINGQLMFGDNMRPMIYDKNILAMVNSAATGQTLSQVRDCIRYYGGRVAGYVALFSNIEELDGLRVISLFSSKDIPEYHSYKGGAGCPQCAENVPLEGIVLPDGYTKL